MSNTDDAEGNGSAAAESEKEEPRISASPVAMSDDGEEHEQDDHGSGHSQASGSEEDEDEEETDEEEEDDEDDEPALKYERVAGFTGDMFKKDSASVLVITSQKKMAVGTHGGFVHILDMSGTRLKSYKPHQASVLDLCVDATGDWIATASMDGQVVILSLSTSESHMYDMKRPIRTVALEPNFAKRSTRAFVSGGMAGNLIMREKGWVGHKDTTLHTGEGPIWQARWRGNLIAWANDLGVKIYHTVSQSRITFIDRPANSPRADLFKCTLQWQDDSTLLISWADHIKVARVRARPRTSTNASSANIPPLVVEITAVFQMDCMVAGILPHPAQPFMLSTQDNHSIANSNHSRPSSIVTTSTPSTLLILAFTPPDTSFLDERTEDKSKQARKQAERPELRIISRAGEELASDLLSVTNFQSWGCNDYVLAEVPSEDSASAADKYYVVLSPRDLILVKPRDKRDHVSWLVERQRYEEALEELEIMEASGELLGGPEDGLTATKIGQKYIEHLVNDGEYDKAARLCPKVCSTDSKRWEDWIYFFASRHQLQVIIPYIPTDHPRLGHMVYEMIIAYFLAHDRQALYNTLTEWPKDIYDIGAVIVAVRSELDKQASTSFSASSSQDSRTLMECLAELYTGNRQYGKALPYFLRLRRPNVIELIREHNLFTDVQDQVQLLVEFDNESVKRRKAAGEVVNEAKSDAIDLLVDNIHSIPIARVVPQLRSQPRYLFMYLDSLFLKDSHLVAPFADLQLELCAEYARPKLIDFLRASTEYHLEKAYKVCQERELVPEMVFLLGRMGNNKEALTLIIEKLGDVRQAIEFAKEQADDDLWEDLLKYSESRPAFIRGLLENVGPEINPIRLIRRIKNGLEIPGLKEALIKILQDFQLQISLLDGCQTILNGDISDLGKVLLGNQTNGFFVTSKRACPICQKPVQEAQTAQNNLTMMFLCRHVVHATCVAGGEDIPVQPDPVLRGVGIAGMAGAGLDGKIAFESIVRTRIRNGCPVCYKRIEGLR
ncbi:vacuolar assembling protein VPS41 [Cylindrobasidium torrendii FP15055 ss-10]|uniref:Vacuolar protein sorting-associated protein 41 n=1 Tax=Cylindrobasidium torrendii FP15055 ss-10 TaxID=1314674 RepID=A0A0D7BE18_9AGAR|nr:vacuolar assembling protein VPS41 [Cylindrobasidium torrendii FP15055 ss-10]